MNGEPAERAALIDAATVVVVAPSRRIVGAGGAWLAIAEWAAALGGRLGPAIIITADDVLDVDRCRQSAFRSSGPTKSRSRPAPQWKRELSTLRKDIARLRVARSFDREVRRMQLAARPDGVVFQYHTLFQRAGARIAALSGRRFVLFVDAPNVWEGRQWGVRRPLWGRLIERFSERKILCRADVVVCISDEVRKQLIRLGGEPTKIVVAGNTVDVSRFERETRSARGELGLDGRTVIGWIGGFQPFHRVDLLIEAYAPLEKDHSEIALLLVGDGPYRGQAEARAAELGLERVVFPGAVPWEDVPRYLKAMDIGAIPAGSGPFHYSPIKLREFAAAGVAVVVPDAGEPGRLLRNGESALMYAPGETEQLRRQLIVLLEDEQLRASVAAGARRALPAGDLAAEVMGTFDR